MNARTLTAARPGLRRFASIGAALSPIHDLSLDVAAGAVAGGMLAARVCEAALPWTWWVVLGASVWAAYTADHLLDARRPASGRRAARHRVHEEHRAPLASAFFVVVVSAAVLAWRTLPRDAFATGLVVLAAVAVHLGLAQSKRPAIPKEVSAAAIYAAGIWAVPIVHGGSGLAPSVLALLWATGAFLNLGVNAWFERGQDRAEGAPSLAVALGRRRLRVALVRVALATSVVAAVAVAVSADVVRVSFVFAGLLQVVPVALLPWARSLRRGGLYRLLGDLAFLAPAVVLAWPAR